MEVRSPGKSEAVTTGNTEKGPKYKVHWRCCVPGCKSNKSILRHAFPKDARLSNSWRDIIKNPDLQDLTTEELRHYRICQLHFAEDKYTVTSVRRIPRNDAIPELMLDLTSAANEENTIDKVLHRNQDTGEPPIDMDLQDKENTAVPGWNVLPTVAEGQQNIQFAEKNSITDLDENNKMRKDISTKGTENIQFSTAKTSKKRPLLGSVTRKGKLTPMAMRLHGIASNLLKRQSKHLHKLNSYKRRIESAKKFCGGVRMKEMQSLSKDQLAFIEMHIRNVHKKAKESINEECIPSCSFH